MRIKYEEIFKSIKLNNYLNKNFRLNLNHFLCLLPLFFTFYLKGEGDTVTIFYNANHNNP